MAVFLKKQKLLRKNQKMRIWSLVNAEGFLSIIKRQKSTAELYLKKLDETEIDCFSYSPSFFLLDGRTLVRRGNEAC